MKKQNHTSHLTLHTSQKGITLIALIITIIVMLILVGVTINVALNGGLFEKSETAKTQTQLETDKEELQIAVVAAYDEKTETVLVNKLEENLPGWIVSRDDAPWIATSPKLNIFTVDERGKITEGNGGIEGEEPGENIPTISTKENYIGCLADVDGDEQPDGIIYADLVTDLDVNNLKEYTFTQKGVKDKFRTRRKRCDFCCERNNRRR